MRDITLKGGSGTTCWPRDFRLYAVSPKPNSAMKTSILILLLTFSSANAEAGQKAVYGEDNRQDYWQLSKAHQELADSVISIWHDSAMELSVDKTFYSLNTRALNELPSMYCPGLKFEEQKAGAMCSGSFIGEDLVLTAGHCIIDIPGYGCEHMKIVFGFNVKNDGVPMERAASAEVYSCKEVLGRYVDSEQDGHEAKGGDYAIIRLDREVKGKKPLKINPEGEVRAGTPLFLMGYPGGLPLKMAGDAAVRNTDQKDGYFMADLDAFKGNSGSPVFNAVTHQVEGLLAAGDADFDYQENGGCFSFHVNTQSGGRGEDVTKISLLRGMIARSRRQGGKVQIKDMPAHEVSDSDRGIVAKNAEFFPFR